MAINNPITGGRTGLPDSWGNNYRNLALQVGAISKIETIKYAHKFSETQT
jgi:hypothetical protein